MRRGWKGWGLALAAAALLAAIVLVALFGRSGVAAGSSVSRGAGGWLAARKYLEARGARVTLWREPLGQLSGDGVLVVTFPWQTAPSLEAAEGLEAHLRRGGDLVLAYSGSDAGMAELLVLEAIGLSPEEVRKPPLSPLAWRRFVREEWELRPVSGALSGEVAPVRVWAPRFVPELPKGAQALYQDPAGRPVIAMVQRLRGRIWLLPVDALANARLGGGNADLLESLLASLGPQWTFDEYHHGLAVVRAEERGSFERILDLVLVHLAVLYGLAVLTLARRFGPPWREPPVVAGSAGSFLLGLGALHHRLGHHREAAQRLLERARELAPDIAVPEELARRAETADSRGLVEVARAVVRLRRGRPILAGDRE